MRRVLVVESEQLLGKAILCLLAAEADFDVFGFSSNTYAALIAQIHHIHPDVVIVDLASRFVDVIQRLPFCARASLCLILVNTEDNWVIIDNKSRVLLTKAADLVRIVHGGQPLRVLKGVGSEP